MIMFQMYLVPKELSSKSIKSQKNWVWKLWSLKSIKFRMYSVQKVLSSKCIEFEKY